MQPLAGFHVLDLTHAVSGPACTHQLRLLGADVIKVEKPKVGDDMRHYTMHAGLENMSGPFIAYNSGKRSITLDLKNPHARPIIDRLVSQADVVVENFRPGVAAQMKLDAPVLMERNPKLVYCSISGFGQTGRMRDWPAYDHIVQAISGMMMMNGSEGQEPIKVGVPLADCFSGYCAAFAITSALLQRVRSGQGQVIDVAMLDALLVLMNAAVVTVGADGKSAAPVRQPGLPHVAYIDHVPHAGWLPCARCQPSAANYANGGDPRHRLRAVPRSALRDRAAAAAEPTGIE